MNRFIKKHIPLTLVLFVCLPCFGQYTKTLGSNEPIPNNDGRIIEVLDTYSGEIKGFIVGYSNGDMTFFINGNNTVYLNTISAKRNDGTISPINSGEYFSDIFKVIIPPQIIYNSKTYYVTLIADKTFETKYVSDVELPSTLKRIAPFAFYKCLNLKNISIPSSVESIGDMAFKNCYALETFKMSNSVKTIGERVFESSYRLKSITLSESLTEIPAYTFWGCKGLETIEIPQSVKSIDTDAFEDCTNLTKVKIHSSTNVSEYAFNNCPKVVIEKYGNTEKPLEEDNQAHIIARKNLQRQIGKFLSIAYRDYILTDEDYTEVVANHFCTSEMRATLQKAYANPCEDGNCFSLSPLLNNHNDGPDNTYELVGVFTTGIDSDWYLVKYKYKGRYLETLIEIVIADNKMWINRAKENIAN